jgi:cytochrome c556
MFSLRLVAAFAGVALGATVVWAQNVDAIKQRREVMREIAKAGTPPFKMSKGELPFELAKVEAGLKTYQDQAAKLKGLFPENSKSGGDTDASPKIWADLTAFEKEVDTFIATAKAAADAIKDEATFKAEYPKVVRSCGACHKETDGFAPRLAESFKKMSQ